jgi:ABC-type dipeptide/oligopeptide/nickel transport system permease subunit
MKERSPLEKIFYFLGCLLAAALTVGFYFGLFAGLIWVVDKLTKILDTTCVAPTITFVLIVVLLFKIGSDLEKRRH